MEGNGTFNQNSRKIRYALPHTSNEEEVVFAYFAPQCTSTSNTPPAQRKTFVSLFASLFVYN